MPNYKCNLYFKYGKLQNIMIENNTNKSRLMPQSCASAWLNLKKNFLLLVKLSYI